MTIHVAMRNHGMCKGKRQVANSFSLTKPQVERLKEILEREPILQEMCYKLLEVSTK